MTTPAPSPAPKLPVSLAANPVLSSWIRFSSEGQVMVSPGKVEIGQGIVTALAQIAADELDVDIGRVQMIRASTAGSPNEGVTSGSLSVQQSGRAIRQACAEIRQIFLTAASDQLGVGHRRARHQGRHDLRAWQYQDELLGACRQDLAGSRRNTRRGAETIGKARGGRQFGSAAGYSRQGFRPSAVHPRYRAAGNAARPRAALGAVGRQSHRFEGRCRARRCRPDRHRARRQFRGRGQPDRGWRRGRADGAAQGRDLDGRRNAARRKRGSRNGSNRSRRKRR